MTAETKNLETKIDKELSKCCDVKLDWQRQDTTTPMNGAKCPKCDTTYLKKINEKIIYVSKDNGKEYLCGKCGETIMAKKVAHSIHYPELGFNAGFGECNYELVPYCPKCEKEPDFHGSSIQSKL